MLHRLLVVPCTLALALAPAMAKTSTKEIEYKRADASIYWRPDVVKSDPTTKIIQTGEYVQKGDSYFLLSHKKDAPKEVYLQVLNDWIEPITPPSMPASLGVPPGEMQIREPQGDVQVALPSNPASFSPAQDGTTIPNGAVVKTGADGTAAVLFGGVNSARLMPNTEATVSQTVTPTLRSTSIDLKSGALFSKVGTRPGDPQKQDYEVRTFNGTAAAKGTDFVTLALPARTDVWVEQGTVKMLSSDGKVADSVTSDGNELKVMRLPAIADPVQTLAADTEGFSAAMGFIPTVNLKLKALRAQIAMKNMKMTANERNYLKRIKKVPCLIKLALVEPPPPPVAAPAPMLAAPTPAEGTAIVSAPPEPKHARHLTKPKLDTRPVPSPAPGASPSPLPPVETDSVTHAAPPEPPPATPAETPAPAPVTAAESAPAPMTGPAPTVAAPPADTAPTNVASAEPPKKTHKKKVVHHTTTTTTTTVQTVSAPIYSGPNDTVP